MTELGACANRDTIDQKNLYCTDKMTLLAVSAEGTFGADPNRDFQCEACPEGFFCPAGRSTFILCPGHSVDCAVVSCAFPKSSGVSTAIVLPARTLDIQ